MGEPKWITLSAFFPMVWASGNLFLDFFAHLVHTVRYDAYSPGLVTAFLFYHPIPIFVSMAGMRAARLMSGSSLLAYLIGGLLILAVIWGGVYHFKV